MNPLRITPALLSSLTLVSLSAPASAEVLTSYQFAGNAAASSVAIGVTASAASWSFEGNQVDFGGTHQSAYAQASSLPTSFNDGKYLTFTLTATEGQVLNLSSFTFAFGGNSSSTGGSDITLSTQVRTSVGEVPFATPLTISQTNTTTATHVIPGNDKDLAYSTFTVDLSAPEFQGLQSISFRLLVATSATSGTRYLRFDNFVIEGQVAEAAIPEPASAAALAAIAVLGFGATRRRRVSA